MLSIMILYNKKSEGILKIIKDILNNKKIEKNDSGKYFSQYLKK